MARQTQRADRVPAFWRDLLCQRTVRSSSPFPHITESGGAAARLPGFWTPICAETTAHPWRVITAIWHDKQCIRSTRIIAARAGKRHLRQESQAGQGGFA
jgi:hypothetical protein